MSILGSFSISTRGMRSQATALGIIGTNVANVNAGGYKRTDPFFQTLKSNSLFAQSDLGGPKPVVSQTTSIQGTVTGTTRELDLAIAGDGLFVTRTTFDTSGETLYTRDGSFELTTREPFTVTDPDTGNSYEAKKAYLVDKNGNFLLGYPADAAGVFPTSGPPEPMRVDQLAFSDNGRPTTVLELALNMDSNSEISGDHLTAVSNFIASGSRGPGMEVLTLDFVDSAGTRQTARLNLTKTSSNTWGMSATVQGPPAAQINNVTLSGAIETGDTYSVTVNGTTASYTATATDTMTTVTSALVAALNGNTTIAADITASSSTSGALTLTGMTVGTSFTASATAANGSPTAQVDTLTMVGTVDAGDSYSVTIDGNTVTYNVTGAEANFAEVITNFKNLINATAPVNTIVTADFGALVGEITLTADTASTSFVSSTLATDGGITPGNTAVISTTQATFNPTGTNTASTLTSTYANGLYTTTPTTLNFNGSGILTNPTPVSFNLTYPPATTGGSTTTATFSLDIDGFTQFANPFIVQRVTENGFESAAISQVGFDASGHVVGFFTSGTSVQLYQIPLATFSNPDALETADGMVFKETVDSGTPTVQVVTVNGQATFLPGAVELSNVSLVDEFTAIIKTQRAYSSSARAFQTVDEMLENATNMKR